MAVEKKASLALNYRVTGSGEPLIALHGLFGSLENLGGITHRLSEDYEIHALDLRNHGRSPHADRMDYPAMAADVLAYMDQQGLEKASVLGHSMGGKTAMELALANGNRVDRLIVADIAPVDYSPKHDAIIAGLLKLDLTALKSRTDADKALSESIDEKAVRQFLLKNLVRDDDGFHWRINLDTIANCYGNIAAAPETSGPFKGPTLFLKGAESAYIQTKHRDAVARLFPNASLRIIPGTSHWLHAEKPDIFANLCQRFLSGALDGEPDEGSDAD